jgi:enolase-phosphatase E1
MIQFSGRGVLLDIEGTTASVRFVYEVLFPFSRRTLPDYLRAHWADPQVQSACEYVAKDAGTSSLADWIASSGGRTGLDLVLEEIDRQMDADLKATGLKQLQGLVWREGYESGELVSQVYPDVPAAVQRWNDAGLDVRIFSSGSVAAQKLFFRYTDHGDLTPYLRGNYDTTTGPKKEAQSYRLIAQRMEKPTGEILFCSDVVDELNAARDAGMKTALAKRPGNAPVADEAGHPVLTSFDQIAVG